MPTPSELDTILAELVPKGNIDAACILDVADLIKKLPQYLAVQIPASVSNVVISAQQPGTDQTDSLWIRTTTKGGVVGIYVFAFGKWQQFVPVPNEVFWLYGDSENPPDGYTVVWETQGLGIDTDLKNYLKTIAHLVDPSDTNGPWDYYPVVFTGF